MSFREDSLLNNIQLDINPVLLCSTLVCVFMEYTEWACVWKCSVYRGGNGRIYDNSLRV